MPRKLPQSSKKQSQSLLAGLMERLKKAEDYKKERLEKQRALILAEIEQDFREVQRHED